MIWELYDTATDWTQAHDLATQRPDTLRALQRLWLIEAAKYHVLPLDERFAERGTPELAGRPELITGTRQVVYSGRGRLPEWALLNTKNKSYAITAEVDVPAAGAEGVIVALGGITGGFSLYAKGGRPKKFCYNFFGLEQTFVEGARALPAGTHQVRMEFAYDRGGLAKSGTVTLFLDGEPVGAGRRERSASRRVAPWPCWPRSCQRCWFGTTTQEANGGRQGASGGHMRPGEAR